MKPGPKRFLHLSNLLVGGTGLAWAWFAYVWDAGPEPEDPELLLEWTGIHPSIPALRTAHLFAAPLLVFAVGLIWSSHIAPRLFRPWKRRVTGLTLVLLFAPMVASGVGLQTASTPEAREAWLWAHVASSLIWIAAYGAHLLTPAKRRAVND